MAPRAPTFRACSTRTSTSPARPGLKTRPTCSWRPAPTIASPASTRFDTSFSGSCSRKTSIPLSAAQATKRRTMSGDTGFDPTRNRPRSAIPSGVVVRASIARIRSHGLSTPRRTARRRRRRQRPRGTRSRRRRGSPRSAARRRSGLGRRAAPATGAGSSCRRAGARRQLTRAQEPQTRRAGGSITRWTARCLRRARCSAPRAGRP